MRLLLSIVPFFIICCLAANESARAQSPGKKSGDAVFFVDSIRVKVDSGTPLSYLNPNDIAAINVTRDSDAVRFARPDGVNGVVFIYTRRFARDKYWHTFAARSDAYREAVPLPDEDSNVVYVVDDKVLSKDIESSLFAIDAGAVEELKVISAAQLNREYKLAGNRKGIIINTRPVNKTENQ